MGKILNQSQEKPVIDTKHHLHFYSRPWAGDPEWQDCKVGTVHGQWQVRGGHYVILGIMNMIPGNGHLDDFFEWFEYSAKRDKTSIIILEIWNRKFYDHLISKRGFFPVKQNDSILIKDFTKS